MKLLTALILTFLTGIGIGTGLWLSITGTTPFGYVLFLASVFTLAWLSARLIDTREEPSWD